MRELTQLSLTIHISLFFTKFLIMDIAPTMRRKEKKRYLDRLGGLGNIGDYLCLSSL